MRIEISVIWILLSIIPILCFCFLLITGLTDNKKAGKITFVLLIACFIELVMIIVFFNKLILLA